MIDTLTYHHIKNKSPKDLFEMRAELHHIDLLSQPETQVTISSPDNIIIIYNNIIYVAWSIHSTA